MIVTLHVAEQTFQLDVGYTGPSKYRWGEAPDTGDLEMPDRAECGTTLAAIIGMWATDEDCSLEEAEGQILDLCADECVAQVREDFDDA